jgi:hypothetical protein
MRGTGQFAELIRQRFDIACRRLQLNARDLALATTLFAVPCRARPAASSRCSDGSGRRRRAARVSRRAPRPS